MPMLTTETGMPLYRPVMVVKPRSELSVNGLGDASRWDAMPLAREGAPTVTYTNLSMRHQIDTHFTSYVRCG